MPSILHLYIKNIDKLVGIFWETGDLDPLQMFSLIKDKKILLEYVRQHRYQFPEPLLEEKLEKINEVKKKYYENLPEMPEWLKKVLREDPLTIEKAEKLLKIFIGIGWNNASIKVQLRILEQRLLGRYE